MRFAGVVRDPEGLGRHDHVCWFYDAPQEYAEASRRFLLEGLQLGERLLCIGEVAIRSATEGESALPDAAELVRSGRLDLLRLPDAFPGDDAPGHGPDQLGVYSAAVEKALADGYTGLRVAAEVTELARRPEQWDDQLRWEHLADRLIAAQPGMAALCAYRADAVDERMRTGLAVVHPVTGGAGPDIAFRLFFDGDVLALSGDIDSFATSRLAALLDAADVAGPTVILDVSRVQFIDGAGTSALADWGRRLAARGLRLRLAGASRLLIRIWALLALGDAAELVCLIPAQGGGAAPS